MAYRLLPVFLILASLATAVRAQERQWTLDASDQDAYLVFGVPESDDVGISLWCPIRRGDLNIFLPESGGGEPGSAVKVVLKADDKSATLDGNIEANEESGIPSLEVKMMADDPLADAMTRADRLFVKAGSADEQVFPLYDADVKGLLDLCRK